MNIYSLEQTHLQYGTQLYDGVAKKNKITTFQKEKLQNSALRKITLKSVTNVAICCVYKECKIMKFPGILNLENCLSLCTKSSIAPNSSVPLIFSYSIFMPKSKRQAQLQLNTSNTQSFRYSFNKNKYVAIGKKSIKNLCIRDWNDLKGDFSDIPDSELSLSNKDKKLS